MLTFIDLFAGIGGFRLGMEMVGHKCLGHCEIDKFAEKSYRAMHDVKEREWYAADIRTVRVCDIPRADVWCFGFPCQDISVAGKQVGFKGNRSGLFFTVTGLLRQIDEESRPKYLFIENVKNLLSINRGYDFARLLVELDEIGYDAEWEVLNSKDFGVPQNRERVFIVGHLRGRSSRKVFPVGRAATENSRKNIESGAQGQKVYPFGKHYTIRARGLHFIDMSPAGKTTEVARCLQARYQKGITKNYGANSGVLVLEPAGLYANASKEFARPPLTGLSRCLKANVHDAAVALPAKAGGGYRIRKLTPRECFRLQGFPDEYFNRAAAVNSDNQLYKQAGNSVTVNVIYEIAKRLT